MEESGGNIELPDLTQTGFGANSKGLRYTNINITKSAENFGYIDDIITTLPDIYNIITKKGAEQKKAEVNILTTIVVTVGTKLYPPIGVVHTIGGIIVQTETYQEALHDHDAKLKIAEAQPFGTLSSSIRTEIRQWDGVTRRDSNGNVIRRN